MPEDIEGCVKSCSARTVAKNGLQLNAAYFTILEVLCDEFRKVLKNHGGLNVTQYRVLLKIYEIGDPPKRINDLATILRLQPNVVTQAVNELERQNLVKRHTNTLDARNRYPSCTEIGVSRIKLVDELLSGRFGEDLSRASDGLFQQVQEAIDDVGAGYETPLHAIQNRRRVQSVYLSALMSVEEGTAAALEEATGATFNECRVVQRIGEVGEAVRLSELAVVLHMLPKTVTRCADRLESRGWARRVAGESDKRAVLLELTDLGDTAFAAIVDTISEVAEERIWSKLDEAHRNAVNIIPEIALGFADEEP